MCGSGGRRLDLHHLHYDTLGTERLRDVALLCRPCHTDADLERAAQSADRQYARGLNTYATKKYGEEWDCRGDSRDMENEYFSWLDRKQNDY